MVAALLAVVLAAGPAGARRDGELAVLAVALPPGPSAELVEVAVQLRQVLGDLRGGVLDAAQLRQRMTGQPPGASLPELDRAFDAARRAHLAGDHEGAVRTLRAVVDDLEKLPGDAEAFRQWTRAVLRLARSELDLGRADASRLLLERLVRTAPDVAVDPELHPARLIRMVEVTRDALRAQPRRALAIAATGGGARVYINGREVGDAPLRLELASGRYRVSAARDGTRVAPVLVDLEQESQTLVLDFTVAEALRPALGPGIALSEEERPAQIAAIGSQLGVDEVIAVALGEGPGSWYAVGQLHDVRRGKLEREGRIRLTERATSPESARALAEFLLTGRADPAVVEPTGPLPVASPPAMAAPDVAASLDLRPPARPPLSPLGWASLGAGAASLGFATMALVESSSASRSYALGRKLRASGLVTNQAAAVYEQVVSEGDAARRRATVGWVGAGTCAVATGLLGYLSYSRTGRFGPFTF